MKEYVITKEKLIDLLRELAQTRTLIAPVKNEFDDVLLMPVANAQEITFDYENTINSCKEYFLPDSEALFSFSKDGQGISIKAGDQNLRPILIFGLRPCDTKALLLLDRFFERGFKDSIYFKKRNSSLIITFACPQCWTDCFCNSTKSGPILESGFDLQVCAVKDRFFLQVGSEKAEAELGKITSFATEAGREDKEEFLNLRNRFASCLPEFDLSKVYEKLKNESAQTEIWQDIANRCQSCGWCLFVCPTCSCFTVTDRRWQGLEQERTRQWDACYFLGFTRLAGGLNPITNKEEMVKRKYQHKFAQQMDEFGFSGCVGCGRCVSCCVGNVNWLENIKRIEQGV
jgi:ferredoxin